MSPVKRLQSQNATELDPLGMEYSDQYGVCRDCWDDVINTPGYLRQCTVKHDYDASDELSTMWAVKKDMITWRRDASQIQNPSFPSCGICAWVHHHAVNSVKPCPTSGIITLKLMQDWGGFNLRMDWNNASDTIVPFVEETSPVANVVHKRPFQTVVDSSAAVVEASRWLKECVEHPGCPLDIPSPLPTRVIDVKPAESSSSVRILHSAGHVGRYAALSYCWGGSIRRSLSVANIDHYQRGLAVASLPKSIQDAIHVTRELNIRYLWVDALCIVQDLEDDKQHEIGRMQAVFQNATVTIVAACSPAATGGFLHQRSLTPFGRGGVFRIPYMLSSKQLEVIQFMSNDSFEYDETEEVINHRAWTLQEQLLSPRCLVYASHTLQWQCGHGTRNLEDVPHKPEFLTASRTLADIKRKAVSATDAEEALTFWMYLLVEYSRRALSVSNDKLNALAGIAAAWAPQFGPCYYAGIWGTSTLEQLLWYQFQPGTRTVPYRAPTWSWASCEDGGLLMNCWSTNKADHDLEPLAKLVHIGTRLKNAQSPFGEVLSGTLTLKAPRRKASLRQSNESGRTNIVLTWPDSNDGRPFDRTPILDVEVVEFPQAVCVLPILRGWTKTDSPHSRIFALLLVESGDQHFERIGLCLIDDGRHLTALSPWKQR